MSAFMLILLVPGGRRVAVAARRFARPGVNRNRIWFLPSVPELEHGAGVTDSRGRPRDTPASPADPQVARTAEAVRENYPERLRCVTLATAPGLRCWPEQQRTVTDVAALAADRGLLHLQQKLGVALGVSHLLKQQLERLLHIQRVQHAAELPDDLELIRRHEDLFLPGAGGVHVHRGEDPLFSMFRAAPKNRLGGYNAVESTPPDRIRPLAGAARL